jgi:hypothetical protein
MHYKRAIVIGVLLLTGLGLIIFGAILESRQDHATVQESSTSAK